MTGDDQPMHGYFATDKCLVCMACGPTHGPRAWRVIKVTQELIDAADWINGCRHKLGFRVVSSRTQEVLYPTPQVLTEWKREQAERMVLFHAFVSNTGVAVTYDLWRLASPHEGTTCPKCGGGLEVDYEAQRVYCPDCEQETDMKPATMCIFGVPIPTALLSLAEAVDRAIGEAEQSTDAVQALEQRVEELAGQLDHEHTARLNAEYLHARNRGGHWYPHLRQGVSNCKYCPCWTGPHGGDGPEGVDPSGDCPGNPKLRYAYELLQRNA